MKNKKFNKKFNKILGELESSIMDVVWREKCASVRTVLNKIKRAPKPAYTTIMTVMSRLCEKGLLTRKLNQEDAYLYRPAQDKETFCAICSRKIISTLIDEYGEDVAVAQFIDIIGKGKPKNAEILRKKLKTIIK